MLFFFLSLLFSVCVSRICIDSCCACVVGMFSVCCLVYTDCCVCLQRLERCVGIVQALTNGLSEREANDALTANVRNISTTTADTTNDFHPCEETE